MENKGKEESFSFEETYDKEKFELDEARLSALLRLMLGFEFSWQVEEAGTQGEMERSLSASGRIWQKIWMVLVWKAVRKAEKVGSHGLDWRSGSYVKRRRTRQGKNQAEFETAPKNSKRKKLQAVQDR